MITRAEAIEIAKAAIKDNPPKGFEDLTVFEPEEWLIQALQRASQMGWIDVSQQLMDAGSTLVDQAMNMQRKLLLERVGLGRETRQ